MLIQFEVENYLSFKDKTVFDLIGADISQLPENVVKSQNVDALKSAIIYGANASGKTNILRSIRFLKDYLLEGWKILDTTDDIIRPYYKLDESYKDKPTSMRIKLMATNDDIFDFKIKFNDNSVIEEELVIHLASNDQEQLIFSRKENQALDIDFGFFSQSKGDFAELDQLFQIITRKNLSFLSYVSSLGVFNQAIEDFLSLIKKMTFVKVKKDFHSLSTYSLNNLYGLSVETAATLHAKKESNNDQDRLFMEKVNQLIKAADIGIEGIDTEKIEYDQRGGLVVTQLLSNHYVNSTDGEKLVQFKFDEFESAGSINFASLAPSIVKTLDEDGILFIDELDSSFHSLLSQLIIKLFNSAKSNYRSQLIFSAHDTSFIDTQANLFRRDQIYFTEKVKGKSDIYSLFDIKDSSNRAIRSDMNFAKNYIKGKYKAVPIIDFNLDLFTKDKNNYDK